MGVKRGVPGAALPALRQRRVKPRRRRPAPRRADRAPDARGRSAAPGGGRSAPTTPFPSRRSGVRASSRAYRSPSTRRTWTSGPRSWASGASSRPARQGGPSYEELVESEGRPRLRMWLERAQTEGLLQAAVVYGYFRCVSEGDDLIVLGEDGARARAVHVPPPAARRAALPGRLLPPRLIGRDRRGGLPARHHGLGRVGRHRRAVRGQRLPRVPGAARPVGPAHRGPRGVLARAGAQGTWHRERGPGRPRRLLQRQVPGRALLDRLPRLPGPGRPRQDRPAAASRSASASSSPRRCSSTPSSPPTPSSSTTPPPATSASRSRWSTRAITPPGRTSRRQACASGRPGVINASAGARPGRERRGPG